MEDEFGGMGLVEVVMVGGESFVGGCWGNLTPPQEHCAAAGTLALPAYVMGRCPPPTLRPAA